MSATEAGTLISLANSIQDLATSLQQLLAQNNLPLPTLSVDRRKDWSDTYEHKEIFNIRSKLIDDTQTLLNLARGPSETLAAYLGPHISEIDVLRTLNNLKVSDAVPLHGEISPSDLAQKVGVRDTRAFEKHLKFAYLMGLFRQTRNGGVAHTALSAALESSSQWIEWRTGKLASQGAFETVKALRADNGGVHQHAVPCALGDPSGQTRSFWDQLGADQDGAGVLKYNRAMPQLLVHHTGGHLSSLLGAFDWEALGPGATIVDVGGGIGHLEMDIAPKISDVYFVVQDLPTNMDAAARLITANNLGDRVWFQAHNFFDLQPELPAGRRPSAYLLVRVLQDWPDKDCINILRNLAFGMAQFGAKLWIVSRILPDNAGEMPVYKEKLLRSLDLLCFNLQGGGERSLVEIKNILNVADARLRVSKVLRPPQSVISLIEVVRD